jgi:hypothetical protein
MAPICRRPACRRDFWKKCRRNWWRSWADRGKRRVFLGSSSSAGVSRTRVSAPHTATESALLLRRRRPERGLESGEGQAKAATPGQLQLHRQHCRVFRLARQEVQRSENVPVESPPAGADSARAEGEAPEIWRRNGLSARRGWGRRQDYGTIPSLRFEETGGEVRAAGEGLELLDWLEPLQPHRFRSLWLKAKRNYPIAGIYKLKEEKEALMANTKKLTKEERKKTKRAARKKAKRKSRRSPAITRADRRSQGEEAGTRPGEAVSTFGTVSSAGHGPAPMPDSRCEETTNSCRNHPLSQQTPSSALPTARLSVASPSTN